MTVKKSAVFWAVVFSILLLSSLPADAEVITLDQAKAMANANSRTLAQYQLNTGKAAYQIDKADLLQTEAANKFYSLLEQYEAIQEQIAALQQAGGDNSQEISALQQKLAEINLKLESQSESAVSSADTTENSEENYEDQKAAQSAYEQQLDYDIEKLYISILNEQDSLETLQLQKQMAEIELGMEQTRLKLGISTQTAVYEKTKSLNDFKQSISSANQKINSSRGALNDIMGRDYLADLELVPFTWVSTLKVPDHSALLDKTAPDYQAIKKAEKAIEDAEEELEDTDDFYSRLILTLEIKEKQLALEEQKLKLNQLVDDLISQIILQQETYESAKLSCQNTLQKYTWDKKRFELGQISRLDLLKSEINYLSARNKQASAGYAMFLAEHSLKLAEKGIL